MSRPAGSITFDNTNRIVIVTGGSSGIGHAICEMFADSGARVICADIVQPESRFVFDSNGSVDFIETDVSNESSVESLVTKVVDQFGAIDVLVNNAVIQPVESFVPLHEFDSQLYQKMIDVNVTGYMFMGKHVLGQMKKQQSGVVINLASAQAHRTAREVPVYGPCKAANLMQAKQWAVEYARDGIRVCSVSPGAINTPLVQASLEQQGGEAELANRHPLGRIGAPKEIAAAVLFLASDGASFITAADLSVDGGLNGLASFADPYEMP